MYREQLDQGWPLPGLASEVASINIKNINKNDVPKWIVRDAVRDTMQMSQEKRWTRNFRTSRMRKQGEPKIIWKPSAYQIADFSSESGLTW